ARGRRAPPAPRRPGAPAPHRCRRCRASPRQKPRAGYGRGGSRGFPRPPPPSAPPRSYRYSAAALLEETEERLDLRERAQFVASPGQGLRGVVRGGEEEAIGSLQLPTHLFR